MGSMTDVMVDLETTGLSPDRNGIIQLSAVKFNVLTGDVGGDFFDRCLEVPETRNWDIDTHKWWSGMPETLAEIRRRAEPALFVLQDFQKWAISDGQLRFWAKPLSFDFPFVQSYFREWDMAMPFHYRMARDMNTHIAALQGGGVEHRSMDLPFVGVPHNAIHDAIHQVKELLAARVEAGLL